MPESDGKDRTAARQLAATHLAAGDPLGWFEPLYASAKAGQATVPWADMAPNRNLVEWLEQQAPPPAGGRAVVIGCGLGDDAEELARRGWQTTAFDLSETAIEWCHKRFPDSRVTYVQADLLNPPPEWMEAFDLVVEVYTLQALPQALRRDAIRAVGALVRPGGSAVVIARGREPEEPEGSMPWPLTRDELARFQTFGLTEISFEDYPDREAPSVRRFRAVYGRPCLP